METIIDYVFAPLLMAVTAIWSKQVNKAVQKPYLDEYFHIRQAQVYCAGNYSTWDPKITTPPGVYLLASALHSVGSSCDIPSLRSLNSNAVLFIYIPLYLSLSYLHRSQAQNSLNGAAHTAMNIVLFPPLFFFTALYYTDVISTEVVVWFYCLTMNYTLKKVPVVRGFVLVLVGILALVFRQTNVFWVGVFSGALDAVAALKQAVAKQRLQEEPMHASASDQNVFTFASILSQSWNGDFVYDPPLHDAYVEDYLISALSIGLASLRKLPVVIRAVLPQILVISAFASFVYWNGGVVLGDKSNHVATIHTPQMLYIWPYILFFSFPVVLPIAYRRIFSQLHAAHGSGANPSGSGSFLRYLGTRLLYALLLTGAALLAVHYNTIIHPFTLADNRHYVFYVFRILRRHWSIKYLAAPVYITCAWLALTAMGGSAKIGAPRLGIDRKTSSKETTQESEAAYSSTTRTSFALIWLATTTLTVISAPLVEPRYYILPWIMWRMHVLPHSSPVPASNTASAKEKVTLAKRGAQMMLWAETLWLLLINAITGYAFLYKGFEWPQEPGAVQRFMW